MTYNLKKSKGGMNAEKTYEFDINVPVSSNKAGKTASGPKGQAAQRGNVSVSVRRKNEAARRAVLMRKQEMALAAAAVKRRSLITESEQRIHTVNAKVRAPLPVGIIFISFVCTVLFMYIIFNTVQISEQNREINSMKSELNVLEAERKDCEIRLEEKNDLQYIEEYALNELGMVKSDQLARQYVNVENEDKIEIIAEDENTSVFNFGGLSDLAESAGTKLSELWEYIS